MAGITEELEALEEKETKITNNKVARFCYEERAYTEDDANGVDNYDFSKPQNIPNATASVMNVNATVLDKGFRSQASSLPRMTINHFFGRVSYNLNKVNDIVKAFIASIKGAIGTANGIASLDENGRIPYSQLPESALEYKGEWDAENNEPALADGTGTKGDMYIVSVAGTQDLGSGEILFFVNDRVIYSGTVWQRFSAGDVKRVNNISPVNGNVTLNGTDIKIEANSEFNIAQAIKRQFAKLFLGRIWKTSLLGGNSYWTEPIYGDGLWVICSSYNFGIKYSTDGINWEDTNITTGNWNEPVYANGVFLVTGIYPTAGMKYSTDGITWNDTNLTDATVRHTVYANGIWVSASGEIGLSYSTDGITWYDSNITDMSCNRPVYANGTWVVGTSRGLKYSLDGMTWNDSNITSDTWGIPVSYANGTWLASGAGLKYSTDGITWNDTDLDSTYNPRWLVYSNGVWLAYAYNKGIKYSTDGIIWKSTSITSGEWNVAVYANGVWVISGANSASPGIKYSSDGINWNNTNITTSMWVAPVYADNVWVIGSTNHGDKLLYSNDGIYWNNTNIARDCNYIAYADGIWLARDNDPDRPSSAIYYSSLDDSID